MKIADEILVKLGIVKKRNYDEVVAENKKNKERFSWEIARNNILNTRVKSLEERNRLLEEENEKLKERVRELKKDYSDEVLKRYEISRLLNGIRKAENKDG